MSLPIRYPPCSSSFCWIMYTWLLKSTLLGGRWKPWQLYFRVPCKSVDKYPSKMTLQANYRLKSIWSHRTTLIADYCCTGSAPVCSESQGRKSLYITPWNWAKQFQSEESSYIIYKKFTTSVGFIYLWLWYWNTVYILDTWRWHGHLSVSACRVKHSKAKQDKDLSQRDAVSCTNKPKLYINTPPTPAPLSSHTTWTKQCQVLLSRTPRAWEGRRPRTQPSLALGYTWSLQSPAGDACFTESIHNTGWIRRPAVLGITFQAHRLDPFLIWILTYLLQADMEEAFSTLKFHRHCWVRLRVGMEGGVLQEKLSNELTV